MRSMASIDLVVGQGGRELVGDLVDERLHPRERADA